MEDERFGACLKRLMAMRKQCDHLCSAGCLAEALGIHVSGVRRWLRGAATPKLDSEHIARIVAHLSLTSAEEQELGEAQVRSLRDGFSPR